MASFNCTQHSFLGHRKNCVLMSHEPKCASDVLPSQTLNMTISSTSKNTEQFQCDLEIEVTLFSALMPGPPSSWPLKMESDFLSWGLMLNSMGWKYYGMSIPGLPQLCLFLEVCLWDLSIMVGVGSWTLQFWVCSSRWQPQWTLSSPWRTFVHFPVTFKTYTHGIESQYLPIVCSEYQLS